MTLKAIKDRIAGNTPVIIFGLCFIFSTMTYAIETPWLTVNGIWLNDPQGNRVVLRGLAVLPPKDQKSRGTFESMADRVTEPNIYSRIIRIPVMPDSWTGQDYLTQYLKPCVDAYTKKKVYVIIDWHYIQDYEALADKTKAFWTIVAPVFKDYSNVFYEIFNEPIHPSGQTGWTTWKKTAQPWVDLIRAAAPKNPIIVGSPQWTQEARFAVEDPFTGSNLIYAIHVYPVHTGWDQMFGEPSKKIPIFLSEWGYQNAGSYGSEVKGTTSDYGEKMKAYLGAHPNVNWTTWIYDYSWYPVMVDQSYKLRGGEDYQGVFVTDFLKEKQNNDLPGGGTRVEYQIINQQKENSIAKPSLSLFGLSPVQRGSTASPAPYFGIPQKKGMIFNVLGQAQAPKQNTLESIMSKQPAIRR